jgi:hypothetical protein
MLAAAFVLARFLHRLVLAAFVAALACAVLAGGLFVPPLYRAFRRLGAGLARVAGTGLTWLLLAPFFYICFTLGRIVLLATGRDPLNRSFPGKETSCWAPKEPIEGTKRYRRQY